MIYVFLCHMIVLLWRLARACGARINALRICGSDVAHVQRLLLIGSFLLGKVYKNDIKRAICVRNGAGFDRSWNIRALIPRHQLKAEHDI